MKERKSFTCRTYEVVNRRSGKRNDIVRIENNYEQSIPKIWNTTMSCAHQQKHKFQNAVFGAGNAKAYRLPHVINRRNQLINLFFIPLTSVPEQRLSSVLSKQKLEQHNILSCTRCNTCPKIILSNTISIATLQMKYKKIKIYEVNLEVEVQKKWNYQTMP